MGAHIVVTFASMQSMPSGGSKDQSMLWLTAALHEYDTLRTEIIDRMQAQRTIMQVGAISTAVLIGLALQRIDALLAYLILGALVPILVLFIVLGSLGEFGGAVRVGNFLARRERVINDSIGSEVPALEWESWLRSAPKRLSLIRDRAEFWSYMRWIRLPLSLAQFLLLTLTFMSRCQRQP